MGAEGLMVEAREMVAAGEVVVLAERIAGGDLVAGKMEAGDFMMVVVVVSEER